MNEQNVLLYSVASEWRCHAKSLREKKQQQQENRTREYSKPFTQRNLLSHSTFSMGNAVCYNSQLVGVCVFFGKWNLVKSMEAHIYCPTCKILWIYFCPLCCDTNVRSRIAVADSVHRALFGITNFSSAGATRDGYDVTHEKYTNITNVMRSLLLQLLLLLVLVLLLPVWPLLLLRCTIDRQH